jgi:hypothetical protein
VNEMLTESWMVSWEVTMVLVYQLKKAIVENVS